MFGITVARSVSVLTRSATCSFSTATKCAITSTPNTLLFRTIPRAKPVVSLLQQSVRAYARRPPPAHKPKPVPQIDSIPAKARENDVKTYNPPTEIDNAEPTLRERVWKAGELSDLHEPPIMTATQRLIGPSIFTLVVVGGSLLYAYYWEAPSSSDRLLPTVPLAFATIATIIALNTAVFIAWRIPIPMNWRILNRYFITVTAMPHSFSMLGSAFSHQTPFHLGMNMLVLYSIGTSLCEQIGSGAFVGLYLSGAVVSSLGSLVFNVTTKRFATSSLGASGAIACIIGAYTYLNPDRELFIIFLPFLAMKAKYMVSCAAAFEVLGMARGWRSLDHAAHFSGMVWGVAGGWMLWKEWQRRIRAAREKRYFR